MRKKCFSRRPKRHSVFANLNLSSPTLDQIQPKAAYTATQCYSSKQYYHYHKANRWKHTLVINQFHLATQLGLSLFQLHSESFYIFGVTIITYSSVKCTVF